MKFLKKLILTCILAAGLGIGVFVLGTHYADEATKFQSSLETVMNEVIKPGAIPPEYKPKEPSGFLAKIFAKHPNNEFVKGITYIMDPEGFAEAHPNNEVGRAFTVLVHPDDFIAQHPNNQLAHTLQILRNTKGFYTDHPHNDLARTLHIMVAPDDFIEKHPNNDLAKAMQIIKGDLGSFVKSHPNNEVSRVVKEIERIPGNVKRCFGLC